MKKVLLIGSSPFPNENVKCRPAAGLRTFQFWKTIKEEGFEVGLAKIAMPECYKEVVEGVWENELVISKDNPDLIARIQKFHDDFKPEVAVAVNNYPAYISSKLRTGVPIWADLNGWIMAEAQAQAFKKGGNDYLSHYFNIEKNVLRVADKISTVSGRQKFAILGELAFLGRLNKETFGYEFCEVIKNASEDFEIDKVAEELSLGLPEDAFVILWIGGYNTWVDEETLFKALEIAMRKYSNIYFVSTGGEIKGLDSKTFANFRTMIDASGLVNRFKFLGWVRSEMITSLYKRADAGINVDRMCIETLTGARNRINEMMKFGLPVITTEGSEIAEEVRKNEAGLAVESGEYVLLAEAIEKIYADKGHFGENGRAYVTENNYKKTLEPLLEWLKEPQFAPDKNVRVNLESGMSLKAMWMYLRENGFKKSFKKFLQKMGGK